MGFILNVYHMIYVMLIVIKNNLFKSLESIIRPFLVNINYIIPNESRMKVEDFTILDSDAPIKLKFQPWNHE